MYYGNFRYRFRFRCPLRMAESNREKGRHVDEAPPQQRGDKRKRVSRGIAFSIACLALIRSTIWAIDAMHAVILNLVRSELEDHLLADLGANKLKPPHLLEPFEARSLDVKDLMKSLDQVHWTIELKDGQVPSISPSHNCSGKSKLRHWKSEEFSNFVLVAPIVLRNLIPKQSYECFCLLHEIYKLILCEPTRITRPPT